MKGGNIFPCEMLEKIKGLCIFATLNKSPKMPKRTSNKQKVAIKRE